MNENQPKYVVVYEEFETFEKSLNDLAQKGYRLSQLQVTGADHPDMIDYYFAVMSLKTDSKYENIANLKDVPPSEVDDYLAQGWIVSDSYSKFIRMVKPGDIHEECPDCDNCERIDPESYEPTYNEGMI